MLSLLTIVECLACVARFLVGCKFGRMESLLPTLGLIEIIYGLCIIITDGGLHLYCKELLLNLYRPHLIRDWENWEMSKLSRNHY